MTAATVRAAIQTLVNAPNPGVGVQTGMLRALQLAADELDAEGIARPPSVGQGIYEGRAGVNAAAAGAQANGEPGSYVGLHDGLVYTPAAMVVTLHRYLLALGWTTTTTQPPLPGAGDSPALYRPAIWRAAYDQGGLAGSHTALSGDDARVPNSLPLPRVLDTASYRLPGGRAGKALAVSVPAGGMKVEVQPALLTPTTGQTAWYGFSFQLSRSFPLDQLHGQVLARFRNSSDGGSYSIGLMIWNGRLLVTAADVVGTRYFWSADAGPVETQRWHDVAWRITFSSTVAGGSTDVYLDGNPGVLNYSPPAPILPASGPVVLRYGLYRDTRTPGDACVYHMGWAAAPSIGSVLLPGAG